MPFNEWFKFEPLQKNHKSILAEDFMKYLAPNHWPKGERKGYCWLPRNSKAECTMKVGFPFKTFWDELGIDFDQFVVYHMNYRVEDEYIAKEWHNRCVFVVESLNTNASV